MKTHNKPFLYMLSSILLLFSLNIFAKDFHGVHSRTLVKLTDLENKMPINELKERDTLVGLSENPSQERSQFVVDVHSQSVNQWVKICLTNKECFETTGNQLLYTCDSSSCDWREAENIRKGEELLSCKGTRHSVANVEEVFAEPGEEFSSVSLYPQHSFCVGESEIVAHNLFPILIGITWAIGGGLTEFFISAGTAAVVASVANEIMKSNKHEERKKDSERNGARPPNISPDGAGRNGAFNKAKEANNIPRSQQPDEVLSNIDKRGNSQPGRRYVFNKGKSNEVIIRDDAEGHDFGTNDPQNRGPHFNDPDGNHYDY